jgi:MFS family permease
MLHRYTVKNAHNILAFSCVLWGVATLSIAQSETIVSQGFFRSVNGGALASILPLSQMMLADKVPSSMHGSAFGLMGLLEKAATTISTSAVVLFGLMIGECLAMSLDGYRYLLH